MAQNELDPYLKWLGIRDPQRPPNHYRLLGVEPLESDLDVIETAADRQMAHVRTYQSGKYTALSQRILNELSQARGVLLDPDKKAEYDRELREQLEAAKAAAQPAAPVARAMPVATALPVAEVMALPSGPAGLEEVEDSPLPQSPALGSLNVGARPRGRSKSSSPVMLIAVGVVVLLIGIPLAVVGAMFAMQEPPVSVGPGNGGNGTNGGTNGNSAPAAVPGTNTPSGQNPPVGGGEKPPTEGTPGTNPGNGNNGNGNNGNGNTGNGNTGPGHTDAPITTNTAAQRLTEARLWLIKRDFAQAEGLLKPLLAAQLPPDLRNEIEATRLLGTRANQAFSRAAEAALALNVGDKIESAGRVLTLAERTEKVGRFEENGVASNYDLTASGMPGWLAAAILANGSDDASQQQLDAAVVESLDPALAAERKGTLLAALGAVVAPETPQLTRALGYNFQTLAQSRGVAGAASSEEEKLPAARAPVSETVAESLRRADVALRARRMSDVRSHLGTASFRAEAQSEQTEIRRMQQLELLLVEFWQAVQKGLDTVEGGRELEGPLHKITVVRMSPTNIVIRSHAAGAKPEESFPREVHQLPAPLAIGLARFALEDTPQRALLEAAFHTVDFDGQRRLVADLLARAEAGGVDIGPVELESKYDYTQLVAMGPAADPSGGSTSPVRPPNGTNNNPGPVVKRIVPEDEPVRTATAEIRKLFAAEYTAAKDDLAKRSELAQTLFNTGRKTDDDLQRYALYQEAALVATSAGDPRTADLVAQTLAQEYGMEPFAKRLEILLAASNKVTTAEAAQAVIDLSEEIASAAMAADQFGLFLMTRRPPRSTLFPYTTLFRSRKHLATRKKEVRELQTQFTAVAAARETLKENPNDSAANAVVGQYLVVAKKDWARALPHLVKAVEGGWSLAAKADLESPTDPTLIVAVGDAWVKVSETASGDLLVERVKERALYWYDSVVEKLDGLERRRIEVAMTKLRPAEGSTSSGTPSVSVGLQLQAMLRSSRWNIEWTDGRTYLDATFHEDGRFETRYRSRFGDFPLQGGRWVMADNEIFVEVNEFRRDVRIRIVYDAGTKSVQMERVERDSGERLATMQSISRAP